MKSLAFFVLVAVTGIQGVFGDEKPIRAVAVINGGAGRVHGNVTFTQNGCGQPVLIEVSLNGLTEGLHGFHIHEKGDLRDGCLSLGAHYNPDKLDHGAPDNEIRHVGDLGNLKAGADGIATTKFSDSVISLTGSRSVLGRGVIVHDGIDDLGLGGHPDSKKTGNAGGRFACGVIGIVSDEDNLPLCGSGYRSLASTILITVLPIIIAALFNVR